MDNVKNFIFTVTILLGGLSTFAFSSNILPMDEVHVLSIEGFREVPVIQLPGTVKNAITKKCAVSKVVKVSANEKE